jgi:ubiquinone/menaquinone biosynthesis C-methylase UbiE
VPFSHERDIAHFDRWAPSYDRGLAPAFFFRPVYRRALERADRLASAPARVLDVGCGTGAFLRLAAAHWPEALLFGVDPAEKMLERARAGNEFPERVEFVRARSEELPFAEAEFDLAVSTMSFHHWGDQAHGLTEVARVLRAGAAFLLADHFIIPAHRPIYEALRSDDRFHSRQEMDIMLAAAGLRPGRWSVLYRIGPFPIVPAVTAVRG